MATWGELGTSGRIKTATVFRPPPPPPHHTPNHPPKSFIAKKGPAAGDDLSFPGGFRLSDFTTPGPQSFLAKSAHPIYYAPPIRSFLKKAVRLIYYVLALNRFLQSSVRLIYYVLAPAIFKWTSLDAIRVQGVASSGDGRFPTISPTF